LSEPRLDITWAQLRAEGRSALIPYLTAGYPTSAGSLAALRAAAEIADIIEVGVPFSDPLADGPTIQRSTFEALRQGMTLRGTLDLIGEAHLAKPIVVFSYLNPVLSYGLERFLHDSAQLGVAGLLLTDLPAGSDPDIESSVARSSLDLIRLIAPTTRPERLRLAVAGAAGFIYLVARLGVTGASTALAPDLPGTIGAVRAATQLPIAVGFGISTPAQAATVATLADGVVVGSALVEIVGAHGVGAAADFLRGMREAMDGAEARR
jgi:tryptophan synthase alpha chain